MMAILSGFFVGIVVAVAVLKLPAFIKNIPSTTPSPTPTVLPTPETTGQTALLITEPSDNAIITNKTVTVKGKATDSSPLAIFSGIDATVAKISDDGSFSADIDVSEGTDTITVVKLSSDALESKTVRVYFTLEDL